MHPFHCNKLSNLDGFYVKQIFGHVEICGSRSQLERIRWIPHIYISVVKSQHSEEEKYNFSVTSGAVSQYFGSI